MRVFFNNVITFINNLDVTLKITLIGMLVILDVLCVNLIIKTHVNPKKMVFKIGQFVLLAVLLGITVFVCLHV